MGFLNKVSIRKYSVMAITLLLAAMLAYGITGTVNAQAVSVVSSGGSIAATGPGGSFVSSGMPYYAGGGGFAPGRTVCYQNDPYGNFVCYRAPFNTWDYPGGAVYRTPSTVVVQSGTFF